MRGVIMIINVIHVIHVYKEHQVHMSIKNSLKLTVQNIELNKYTSKSIQEHKHLYKYTMKHGQGMYQQRHLSVTAVLNDKQFQRINEGNTYRFMERCIWSTQYLGKLV